MARTINKLTAQQVSKATKPGRYGDGGGLWLQVSQWGTKSWIFRFMLNGKARQMGLGDVNTFSLKEARERAREARQLLADGVDPIEARREKMADARAEDAARLTFKEATDRYIKAHGSGWRNAKHGKQWRNTLKAYAWPVIGDLDVADIADAHISQILDPIWVTKTETASRVRSRIQNILDWARVRGFRPKGSDNPARWSGHLDQSYPKPSKVKKTRHHPAMAYADLPAFMGRLRERQSISAKALEFTILTAARTGEVIGAKWSEIDFTNNVWTMPKERTKSNREYRVPLSDAAVALLKALPREQKGDGFVFPGARKGRGLSSMAMLELLKGMENDITVHGFRSTFRDWAGEETNFPRTLAEQALSHIVGDKTEQAYRRGDALEKRRRLMTAWAKYCNAPASQGRTETGKVVGIRRSPH